MALGFGFNKAKVLASAEKFVQQGKLPNAIQEYEKVVKEDPKDLTVLNTIGDLYARVGQNEQAAHYFRKVGDQYAQNGFTVKAIAIYKKLTKLIANNTECITRLAELYTQQGLFNDARAQYMQIADGHLRSGENNQAARIFQRILELDPENTSTQSKLADLYMKLGRKDEARNIFYTAAESLYSRGMYDGAKEALDKVITLDPGNAEALLLRGMIAADSGDSTSAIRYLEQVADLDSRPQALRALLRAQMDSGNVAAAEPVVNKLLTAHKDASGMNSLAEWYLNHNQVANALKLYERNADQLFAGGPGTLQETIYPLINKIRDNPDALNSMMRLLQGSGDATHTAEILELQAHAFAQKGDYQQARDLYKKLSELEPENALHSQNYRQMLAKLGEDSATRILSPEEAAQAFMVEELDQDTTVVQQKYDPPTETAIEAALTDAELFVSYNVPSKAIAPLEAALPLAPHDINLNQRLASLYAKAERYGDAARMCQNLSEIYRELGHTKEAAKYQEAARKYGMRAGGGAAPAMRSVEPPARREPELPTSIPVEVAPEATLEVTPAVDATPSVQEFSFDIPDHLMVEPEAVPIIPAEIVTESSSVAEPDLHVAEANIEVSPAPELSHEIDLSNEWEDMISVETEETSAPEAGHEVEVEITPEAEPAVHAAAREAEGGSKVCYAVDEKIQEIEFFIAQHMWEEAKTAILNLTDIAPDDGRITELMAAVSAGQAKSAPMPHAQDAFAASMLESTAADFLPPPFAASAPTMPSLQPAAEFPLETVEHHEVMPPQVQHAEVQEHKPQAVAAAQPRPAVEEPVLELEDDIASQARSASTRPGSAAAPPRSTEDILSDFVLDLEKSDLADFAPKPQAQPVTPPKPAAAASASASAKTARSTYGNGEMQDADAASVLNDILTDLQEENAEAAEAQEDPETHYNLGIAFKEMGLLDEAIGELQKVCHAVDKGSSFSQPIQAYTWLAQCLVDKGAPEAAVRWYQKALHLPGLDDGSRCAIYYDLASAYEAFGDKKSALSNFMEVYGSNIDFRDVASRIKALKS